MRLGYVALRASDLDGAVAFYSDVWGLGVSRRDGDRAYLRATDGSHHALRLRQADARGLDEIGFECDGPSDLDLRVAAAEQHGSSPVGELETDPEPGVRLRQVIADPQGTRVGLYVGRDGTSADYGARELKPTRIGHVVLMTEDLDASLRFYTEALGFQISDWLWPFAAFLRCNEVHHSLALFAGERSTLQHVAWEVPRFDDVMVGVGHMARHGHNVIWGPGRHAVGENIFTYYKDPEGNVIEYFAEVELFPPQGAREPRRYEMGEYGDDAWRLAGAAPEEVRE